MNLRLNRRAPPFALVAATITSSMLVLLNPAPAAFAQSWPAKNVRLIVPFPPGGNVDNAARVLAPALQDAFGQPFLIENRPGAGGMIGAEMVVKAPPDGYTLFVSSNGPLLFSPLIFGRPTYDWSKDFAPVSSISFTALVLQVHPSVPVKTVAEFVALVRKQPGKLAMATPGGGTTNHLLSELMQSTLGLNWITVHYKGNAPASTDLLAGHVHFNFDQVAVSLPFIRAGRLRPLAVSSFERTASLPEVPTFAEAGLKGMEAETFTALAGPAAMPRDLVNRLSTAMIKVLSERGVAERFAAMGALARGSTPEDIATYMRREFDKWAPVIRRANIKAD